MSTIIGIISLLLNAVILYLIFQRADREGNDSSLRKQVERLELNQERLEKLMREEFAANRLEWNRSIIENRRDLSNSFNNLTQSTISTIRESSRQQKDLRDSFSKQLNEMAIMTERKQELLRDKVEEKLNQLQEANQQKLEQMRQTVDEKLHQTLEQRLGESFQMVSERLERVHKSLGEMHHLATGVDDLRKVLSNVKNRGVLGEIQLENILEQLLTPDQYSKNATVKENSKENVEFAIKLPAKDAERSHLLLPIDSKFPLDDYQRLTEAQERGQADQVQEALKNLEARIKQEAKKIADKYINPPTTTDFAILFLPIEGLYAEILRRPGLWEHIQRQYKVAITGPTTLSAFLTSLHMGFRTLAIQKHTNEAWKWLSLLKTELFKFGDTLTKAQRKLDEASKTIGQATKQTETMKKKLNRVENLPELGGSETLPLAANDERE
jgi:DNA recombination protein RmuC